MCEVVAGIGYIITIETTWETITRVFVAVNVAILIVISKEFVNSEQTQVFKKQ